MLVHNMYGNPAFSFVIGYHGFVHMVPIHSFAAIVGQQGRVDVDYMVGIGIQYVLWHQP